MAAAGVLAACGGGGGGGNGDPGGADVLDAGDVAADPGWNDQAPEDRFEDEAASRDERPGDGETSHEPGDPGAPDQGGWEVADAGGIPCEVLPPLALHVPFEVEGGFPGGAGVDSFLLEAVVADRGFRTDPGLGEVTEWRFRPEDGGDEVVIRARLPLDYEIPVALGQRVTLFGARMQGFEWRDLAFVIWDRGPAGTGQPVFFFYDASHPGFPPWHQCAQKLPCPTARMLESPCVPEETDCGRRVHPPLEILAHGGLSSKEIPLRHEQGETRIGFEGYRYMAVRSERFTERTCLDVPDTWLTALAGKSGWVSQCLCREDEDCAAGFFCDPTTSRCLEDLCRAEALSQAGKNCKEGFVCDPYRGECRNPATTLVTTCKTDQHCGSDEVCNVRGRLCSGPNDCDQTAPYCVNNPCVILDCAPPCHALLGRCVDCIADCECERAGTGDFCNDLSCDACDPARIGFGQENPERYEFFEVCAKKNGVDPAIELKGIDPSISCMPGGGGVFAKCDPDSEVRCHGDLEFVPGLKWITDEKWSRMCRVADLPWVTKVAGGYYL